jgi:hypothetical protein
MATQCSSIPQGHHHHWWRRWWCERCDHVVQHVVAAHQSYQDD